MGCIRWNKIAGLLHAPMKLADYCGKIQRNMLHKPEIVDQSTRLTSRTCDASSVLAIDPGVGEYSLKPFSTPMVSVKTLRHMMLEKGGQSTWAKKISSFGL